MDSLMNFRQYYDYRDRGFYGSQVSRNVSMVLQLYCEAAHNLPSNTVPILSKQGNLHLTLKSNDTSASQLPRCYKPSTASVLSDRHAPLSSDFCVVVCQPILYVANLTDMLATELVEVTSPAFSTDPVTIIVSVACPEATVLVPSNRVFCDIDEVGWKELMCLNSLGFNTTVRFSCLGIVSYNSSCLDLNLSNVNCSRLYCAGYGGELSCRCSLSSVNRTTTIEFHSLVSSVLLDFYSTVSTIDKLSGEQRRETMLATFCVIGLVSFAMWLVGKLDESHKLRVANEAIASELRERKEVAAARDDEQLMAILSSFIAKSAISTFPVLFNRDSMSVIFIDEVKKSHRWASLLFHYNPHRSRIIRLLMMFSLASTVMFLNALLFNITHFESDRSCEQHINEVNCIEEKSRFSVSDSKCYWDPYNVKCQYKLPNSIAHARLSVLFIAVVFSVPILLVLESIAEGVLTRPTAVIKHKAKVAPKPFMSDLGKEIASERDSNEHIDEGWVEHACEEDFEVMMSSLIDHRANLTIKERLYFDQKWGFPSASDDRVGQEMRVDLEDFLSLMSNPPGQNNIDMHEVRFPNICGLIKKDGEGITTTIKRKDLFVVFKRILNVMTSVLIRASREVRLCRQMTDRERRKRLIFLFQQDLLADSKRDIIVSLGSNDLNLMPGVKKHRPVNVLVKIVFFSVVVLTNISFLSYSLLFSVKQDSNTQAIFFKSLIIWLALEVVVISTIAMIVTQVVFPLLVLYKDIAEIKKIMRQAIEKFLLPDTQSFRITPQLEGIVPAPMHPSSCGTLQETRSLDICPYLFVSHRVASAFPDLAESMVIQSFHSSYPKETFRHVVNPDASQSRLLFSGAALLNSLNTCVIFVVNGIINSVWGYHIVSVANWCIMGFLYVIKSNSLNLDGIRGIVFVLLIWASFGFIIKDMLRRMDVILKEQNKLKLLTRRARRKKKCLSAQDGAQSKISSTLRETHELTSVINHMDFSERNITTYNANEIHEEGDENSGDSESNSSARADDSRSESGSDEDEIEDEVDNSEDDSESVESDEMGDEMGDESSSEVSEHHRVACRYSIP
jgi:hypothetical protein